MNRIPILLSVALILVLLGGFAPAGAQQPLQLPHLELGVEPSQGPGDVSLTLQLLFFVTILSIAPSILLMMTSFTRIVIVLSFISRALSLQQMPPRQVIIGLALFLTAFVMAPTGRGVYTTALRPYLDGKIGQVEALEQASVPMRVFMFKNTSRSDLAFFLETARVPRPGTRNDVPIWVLIPAFMLTELKEAFLMGVLIFIPFVVIDMAVASVLMSMGMMMLPPVMISLPFKILLFVLVDGWSVIAHSLVRTYGL